MRTLILSTGDSGGGAAIASYRLHRGLSEAGVESRMLVLNKRSSDERVASIESSSNDSDSWLQALAAHINTGARTNISNTYFSLPWPGVPLANHPWVKWAEVINLHWISGLLSPDGLREILALGKPVVWTLHDQRAFTGGCHYAYGCIGFRDSCRACPQLQPEYQNIPEKALQHAAKALEKLPPVTIVTPSRWLAKEAKSSRLLGECRTEVVPNGIDLTVFNPSDRRAAREALGLPLDALIFMFGASMLQEYRKGFDLFSKALHALLKEERIAKLHGEGKLVFAAYGSDESTIRKSGLPVRLLGQIDHEAQMAATMAAADLIICPTREDNLPNMIMESMACGVPVLSCHVGGVPDMIEDRTNGRVVPAEDADSLTEALLEIILQPSLLERWGPAARVKCEQEYAQRTQGERYLALFQSLTATAAAEPPLQVDYLLAQNQLLSELANAQGHQLAGALAKQDHLRTQLKTAKELSSKAALKKVEEELGAQDALGWKAWCSPTRLALRTIRRALRKKNA